MFRENIQRPRFTSDNKCLNKSTEHVESKILKLYVYLKKKKTSTKSEINLLLKGFKFIISPNSNVIELKAADKEYFSCCLRFMEFFSIKNINGESIVRNKSYFTPYKGNNKNLDSYKATVSKSPLRSGKYKQILPKEEKGGFTNTKGMTTKSFEENRIRVERSWLWTRTITKAKYWNV